MRFPETQVALTLALMITIENNGHFGLNKESRTQTI